MDSRILFSCSLAAEEGPWLETTEEAETRRGGEMEAGGAGGGGRGRGGYLPLTAPAGKRELFSAVIYTISQAMYRLSTQQIDPINALVKDLEPTSVQEVAGGHLATW